MSVYVVSSQAKINDTSKSNIDGTIVDHIIDAVLILPTITFPNRLFFRGINNRFGVDRCGEVNAGPRMPASLFDPSNEAALKKYEQITCSLYGMLGSPLQVGRCRYIGYNKGSSAYGDVPWAPTSLMVPICEEQCGCTYPDCADVPDNPKAEKFCLLCGPNYNGNVIIDLWTK